MQTKKIFLALVLVVCATCMICTSCSGGGGGGTAFLKSLFSSVDGVWLEESADHLNSYGGFYLIDGNAFICWTDPNDKGNVAYTTEEHGTYTISGSTVTIKFGNQSVEAKWSDDTLTYSVDGTTYTFKRHSANKIVCAD